MDEKNTEGWKIDIEKLRKLAEEIKEYTRKERQSGVLVFNGNDESGTTEEDPRE